MIPAGDMRDVLEAALLETLESMVFMEGIPLRDPAPGASPRAQASLDVPGEGLMRLSVDPPLLEAMREALVDPLETGSAEGDTAGDFLKELLNVIAGRVMDVATGGAAFPLGLPRLEPEGSGPPFPAGAVRAAAEVDGLAMILDWDPAERNAP